MMCKQTVSSTMEEVESCPLESEHDTDMPVRMTSEKFIRAERRNRLETYRLNVRCKHYDRETVRSNYEIDREKRTITRAFKKVVKTSGASDMGMPPKDSNDLDFERAPSYTMGLKLSNKRLVEWRECEKQLDKFITSHEMMMAKENRKKVIRKTKPLESVSSAKDEEDSISDDVFSESNSSSTTNADKVSSSSAVSVNSAQVSPIDILKADPENENEVFDIKKWEKEIIDSYKKSVCNSGTSQHEDKPVKDKLRSKSSPTLLTNNKTEFHTEPGGRRQRPHTAHTERRQRPMSSKSLPPRPVSAKTHGEQNQKFLITKETTFIKNGTKFEKFIENRPVDKPLLVNNYTDSLKPGTHSSSQSTNGNGLCPVQEDNEDGFDESDNNSNIQTQSSGSSEEKRRSKPVKKTRTRKQSYGSMSTMTRQSAFHHSNSDLSSLVGSTRRMRRDSDTTSVMSSVFSRPLSRSGSTVSSVRPSISLGIPADIEDMSRVQDKLANEISPEKPLSTNKLISVGAIVKAAMTFSRVARKRALHKMQEENSAEPHELIRQERLRKLQSRQNVLNCIAKQWDVEAEEDACIEQVE